MADGHSSTESGAEIAALAIRRTIDCRRAAFYAALIRDLPEFPTGRLLMKFLHAADIHLDSPLRGLDRYEGAPVDEIREASRHALRHLVSLAVEEAVDFLLIAGDIYDGDWKDHNTGLFFVSQMTRLREAGIPVIMIRGNHDAASRVAARLRLPDNVTLLPHDQPQRMTLDDCGAAIHGQSFAKQAERDNLALKYLPAQAGLFNIGLLHTALTGAEGHEPYAPCTLDDLRSRGYDYWALGHIHLRQVVAPDPLVVFPGNLQGRHIRETGAKGAMLVSVDPAGNASAEFRALDVFRWEHLELTAQPADIADDVLDQFRRRIERAMDESEDRPLAVRLTVAGRTRAHADLLGNVPAWTNQFRAVAVDASGGRVWLERVALRTSPREAAQVNGDAGPLGELHALLAELRSDPDQAVALADCLRDLTNRLPVELRQDAGELNFDDAACVRRLLDDVEPLLTGLLHEGAGS